MISYRFRLSTLFIILLLVVFTPFHTIQLQAAANKFAISTIYKKPYYHLSQVAAKLGLKYTASGEKCELVGKDGRKLIFAHNKRSASINGVNVVLDFAVIKYKSGFYLSVSDYKYLIDPLYNKNCLQGKRPKIIVIDAGHGGRDQGAAGLKSLEKNLALSISRRLRDKLRHMGYTVYMTRDTDVKIELAERAAKARRLKADVFVSIHMNAAANKSVRGVETYALTPPGAPSSADTKSAMPTCRGYAMAKNSTALAFSVQSQIVRSMIVNDRGLKRARFKVLTENTAPGILVECGFISNTQDETLLCSVSHQDKLAAAIASGIDKYAKRLPTR